MPDLGFEHLFQPGSDPTAPTLLLLHGTGGDEHDLVPLGKMAPGAALLSPRGKVLEAGMPRFFRRLAEGVFDLDDLRARAAELARFLGAASARYGFDAANVFAVGFSNGANIGSAVVLLHPGVLRGGVLFRAMVPLIPDPLPQLAGTRLLVSNGRSDPLVSTAETERLVALFRQTGAETTLEWQPAGHQLTRADLQSAERWLRSVL